MLMWKANLVAAKNEGTHVCSLAWGYIFAESASMPQVHCTYAVIYWERACGVTRIYSLELKTW